MNYTVNVLWEDTCPVNTIGWPNVGTGCPNGKRLGPTFAQHTCVYGVDITFNLTLITISIECHILSKTKLRVLEHTKATVMCIVKYKSCV